MVVANNINDVKITLKNFYISWDEILLFSHRVLLIFSLIYIFYCKELLILTCLLLTVSLSNMGAVNLVTMDIVNYCRSSFISHNSSLFYLNISKINTPTWLPTCNHSVLLLFRTFIDNQFKLKMRTRFYANLDLRPLKNAMYRKCDWKKNRLVVIKILITLTKPSRLSYSITIQTDSDMEQGLLK